MSFKDQEFITGTEFRKQLNISPSTLNRWIKAGKIKVIRLSPNSPVRIPVSEVEKLIGEYQTHNKPE